MDRQEKLHGFSSSLCEYLVILEADVKAVTYSIRYSYSSFLKTFQCNHACPTHLITELLMAPLYLKT